MVFLLCSDTLSVLIPPHLSCCDIPVPFKALAHHPISHQVLHMPLSSLSSSKSCFHDVKLCISSRIFSMPLLSQLSGPRWTIVIFTRCVTLFHVYSIPFVHSTIMTELCTCHTHPPRCLFLSDYSRLGFLLVQNHNTNVYVQTPTRQQRQLSK